MNIASLILLSTVLLSPPRLACQESVLRISLPKPPAAYRVGDTPIIEVDLWNDSDVEIYIDWRDSDITDSVVYSSFDEDTVPFLVSSSFHGVNHRSDPVGIKRAKYATVILPRQVSHLKAVLSKIQETPFNQKILNGGKIKVSMTAKLMNTSDLQIADESWSESRLEVQFPLIVLPKNPQ